MWGEMRRNREREGEGEGGRERTTNNEQRLLTNNKEPITNLSRVGAKKKPRFSRGLANNKS
jgi:hypothetical protein